MPRVMNFSAGPATLPPEVIEEAREQLSDYQGLGMSLLEASHRGKAYMEVHAEAGANLRDLLELPESHAILFLQGGASLQFAMVPLNFLPPDGTADYAHSGSWAGKAVAQARRIGRVHLAADCGKEMPTRVPVPEELDLTPGAAYLHLTSNETISGAQWKSFPATDAPLVADMSSDILSRPLDAERFHLIYAGAQKNLGPAGVTIVIVRKAWAESAPDTLPDILRYATHIREDSMYNTPPCFGIYIIMLVTRLLKREGLKTVFARNREKAALLYAAIDGSDFYRGTAHPGCRSDMNVTFRLPGEELEARFVKEAEAAGLSGLKGHRSVGGLRASIYNAFPIEGVEALVGFMRDFEKRCG